MVLAVTDRLGGVGILINAAARPNTGAVAGIDTFDDPEFSEQINVKVLGTGTTRRAAAARTRPDRRARDEPQHRLASPAAAPRRRTAGVPARPRHHRGRHPQRGAVLTQARELVRLARQHGYRRDELIQVIESLP
jgi:NAD(P)-dependent dehydrogenase (short-subunit alcohol dehydrogenase family)